MRSDEWESGRNQTERKSIWTRRSGPQQKKKKKMMKKTPKRWKLKKFWFKMHIRQDDVVVAASACAYVDVELPHSVGKLKENASSHFQTESIPNLLFSSLRTNTNTNTHSHTRLPSESERQRNVIIKEVKIATVDISHHCRIHRIETKWNE